MDKVLLPEGFRDIVFPGARIRATAVNLLMNNFSLFGFEQVEPPLLEFEETLFKGEAQQLKNKAFRVMDPESHKMLAIRNDMTSQVIRMVKTRYNDSSLPLRLSYNGRVVFVEPFDIHGNRQLMQTGIELIGNDSSATCVEVIYVALDSLKKLKVKNVSVDFTLPGLVDILLRDLKVDLQDRAGFFAALLKKDTAKIESLLGKKAELFVLLCQYNITLEKLQSLKLSKQGKDMVADLAEIINALQKQIKGFKYTIDPLEVKDIGYHKGVGFSIFSKDVSSELGRGGKYEISLPNGKTLSACGFSLYLDSFITDLSDETENRKVYVPFGIGFEVVGKLRSDAFITIFGLEKEKDVVKAAKLHGCGYVYDGSRLKEI